MRQLVTVTGDICGAWTPAVHSTLLCLWSSFITVAPVSPSIGLGTRAVPCPEFYCQWLGRGSSLEPRLESASRKHSFLLLSLWSIILLSPPPALSPHPAAPSLILPSSLGPSLLPFDSPSPAPNPAVALVPFSHAPPPPPAVLCGCWGGRSCSWGSGGTRSRSPGHSKLCCRGTCTHNTSTSTHLLHRFVAKCIDVQAQIPLYSFATAGCSKTRPGHTDWISCYESWRFCSYVNKELTIYICISMCATGYFFP